MTPEQHAEVEAAMRSFWEVRSKARDAQTSRGVAEPGERAGVTAGGHLDHVAHMLANACIAAGAAPTNVYYKAPKEVTDSSVVAPGSISPGFTLPGFYRPTKMWDVVVRANKRPIVAIELKSQLGPSFGNNANNRAEEAIGTATDLAKAVKNGLLPEMPWIGYVYVIEDDPASNEKSSGKRDRILHPKDEIFNKTSYQDRVRILCRRLKEERVYDNTWAIATKRPYCPNEHATKSVKESTPCSYLTKKFKDRNHVHEFGFKELDQELIGYSGFIDSLTAVVRHHCSLDRKENHFREHWDPHAPTLYDQTE
ncbi:hypothetical protein G3I59_43760 [Amycolatopsis rubida]|uniref:Restriction endonuclease XhoI n=1 Tax=Amycolatopsis rubida TaxID=112413 RepID=A0ABX0C3J3_9PSEU|nr:MULTISPECIES: PaeR7I family type II restriction endonuclease [Amycolatopsis]MYW97359.1 hypothetical protein [Amycolatopsis rubida]NEC62344.1 hypothetical protein [Amycolatopsis rubida]